MQYFKLLVLDSKGQIIKEIVDTNIYLIANEIRYDIVLYLTHNYTIKISPFTPKGSHETK